MMIRVVVIEDEKLAADKLADLITQYRPGYEIVALLDSIEGAVEWLKNNQHPDLILLDIHLADGNSFEIFKKVEIESSIIFSTAYDQYAIQAFKVNSVDYLLKPIDKDDLYQALEKFEKKQNVKPHGLVNLEQLISSFNKPYKTRFVIKVGDKINAVEVDHIHFFYSEEKMTYLQTDMGKRFIIDYPLDKVESMVDPGKFFRISRKYLVSFHSISEILSHSNSRLRLVLTHCRDNDVIVSRERVSEFKNWLDG